jgi:hypothetical protein
MSTQYGTYSTLGFGYKCHLVSIRYHQEVDSVGLLMTPITKRREKKKNTELFLKSNM